MELIEAKIINFGKLSNQNITFNKGLNSFLHENGWGKTTLTVFIKSMFYGMEYTTSKDIEKNERQKYKPWQGGVYGGSLSFSHNGKKYRVSRIFGAKKGEDSFELINLDSNKISNDFSTDLGNELFGINRDTYGRSVHVVLGQTIEGSDDISARLNNLVEDGDVSNFENARKTLEEKATALKAKKGSGGLLSKIQEQIEDDRRKLEEIEGMSRQNEKVGKALENEMAELEQLSAKQMELTTQMAGNAKWESKVHYLELKDNVAAVEKEIDGYKDFFGGVIPSAEVVSNIDSIARSFISEESNANKGLITKSEKDDYESLNAYFGGDIPAKEDISKCLETDRKYKDFKQKESEKRLNQEELQELDSLKRTFNENEINDAIIEKYSSAASEIQTQKTQLIGLESDLKIEQAKYEMEQQNKQKNTKRTMLVLSGAVSCIISVVLFVTGISFIAGCSLLGVGIVFVVYGFVSKPKKTEDPELLNSIEQKKQAYQQLQEAVTKKENDYKAFIARYSNAEEADHSAFNKILVNYNRFKNLVDKSNSYKNWLASEPMKASDYEEALKVFICRYCKSDNVSNVPALIQILNEKLQKRSELSAKINSSAENQENLNRDKEKLTAALVQYKTNKSENLNIQVQEVHSVLTKLENAKDSLEQAKRKVEDFENDPRNNIEEFASLTKPEKDTETLQNLINETNGDISEKNRIIDSYKNTIDANNIVIEKTEDIETDIECLSEQKKEKTEEYAMLNKTIELLSMAKEKLDENYSAPMTQGFDRYIKMIGSNLDLVIDTDLKVSVDESGMLHDSNYLSEGYKDIVNFCSRMALVDALFEEVKPPVILDDPFVNLDDSKVPNALELVKKMAEEKQILYFACHKSRDVSMQTGK